MPKVTESDEVAKPGTPTLSHSDELHPAGRQCGRGLCPPAFKTTPPPDKGGWASSVAL